MSCFTLTGDGRRGSRSGGSRIPRRPWPAVCWHSPLPPRATRA